MFVQCLVSCTERFLLASQTIFQKKQISLSVTRRRAEELRFKNTGYGSRDKPYAWVITRTHVVPILDQNIFLNLFCNAVIKKPKCFFFFLELYYKCQSLVAS